MELRQLEYFCAVVEEGSFTAAARRLHMTQPSLSSAVRALEGALGVTLLVRGARGVEPTSAGRFLLDSAQRILGEVRELTARLRAFEEGLSGSLTVACVPALMWSRMPRLLRAFREAAPTVDVRVVDPPPWQAIEMVTRHRADAAAILVADPKRFAERHGHQFVIVDWGEVRLKAVLPPDRVDPADPFALADLEHETLLMPRRTGALASLPEVIETVLSQHGVRPHAVRETDTIQASLPLIEAGYGVGLLPDADDASLARFRAQVREVEPSPTPLRAVVLLRRGSAEEPALRNLVEHLAQP